MRGWRRWRRWWRRWWRRRWWRRSHCALRYVEGVLGQRIDGVGLVYHPNCGISRLAHGQVDPLIYRTPPVDDVTVLPFCAALGNGDSRGNFAKRSKEIVDVAKCPEAQVVSGVLGDIGADVELVPFAVDANAQRRRGPGPARQPSRHWGAWRSGLRLPGTCSWRIVWWLSPIQPCRPAHLDQLWRE